MELYAKSKKIQESSDNLHKKLPDIPIIGEKHEMKVTLSRMKCREYGLCTFRINVSLYYSYTMWKSRVGSCASKEEGLIDFIYRSILIEGYLYIFVWCTYISWRLYSYRIHILISRRRIGISYDGSKSISHSMIPIWRCYRRHFSWYGLWRISRYWLCKRGEMIHRAIYTSKYEESEESAEPFLLSILTLSWNEMFHKLYKKSKIIIAYIFPWVNTYLIKYINVKYQLLEKSGFFMRKRYILAYIKRNIIHCTYNNSHIKLTDTVDIYMSETTLSFLTILYASAWVIALLWFFPTLKDLFIKRKNSANPLTAVTWATTNGIATLYGYFVVNDLLFTLISWLSCCCFIAISSMSFYLSKKWISYESPSL